MAKEISKNDFIREFGNNLNKTRSDKNLSYRQLAQRCDIDYSHISRIEKGEINIQLSTVLELAKGLEIHPKELFNFKLY